MSDRPAPRLPTVVRRARRLPSAVRRRRKAWMRARRAARVEVRQVSAADAEAMARFWGRVSPRCMPDMTLARLERVLAWAPELVLVVEERGEIVATAVGTHDSIRAYVYGVAVDPAVRRRATGTALIGELERRYRVLGFERVYALVLRDDPAAAGFCASLGYTEFRPAAIYRHRGERLPIQPVPPDVSVRLARPDDVDAIVELWVTCDLVHDPERSRREAFTVLETFPQFFRVAEIDGVIVGASFSTLDGVQSWGYRQAVSPTQRRRGVGVALAQAGRDVMDATDIDWWGNLVLDANPLGRGYGRARESVELPDWAFMRKRLASPIR